MGLGETTQPIPTRTLARHPCYLFKPRVQQKLPIPLRAQNR